jgi:hypothetical protein
MLPFADVMHLFTNKFTRLRAGRFALSFVLTSASNRSFFRHCRASCVQTCGSECLGWWARLKWKTGKDPGATLTLTYTAMMSLRRA